MPVLSTLNTDWSTYVKICSYVACSQHMDTPSVVPFTTVCCISQKKMEADAIKMSAPVVLPNWVVYYESIKR
jgi:hypothetical protein